MSRYWRARSLKWAEDCSCINHMLSTSCNKIVKWFIDKLLFPNNSYTNVQRELLLKTTFFVDIGIFVCAKMVIVIVRYTISWKIDLVRKYNICWKIHYYLPSHQSIIYKTLILGGNPEAVEFLPAICDMGITNFFL